jgi:DDE superfamily endonuclease
MSLQAFMSLVDMLYQYISYDYLKYGFTITQLPVQADITVAIGLCWLAGGSYLDLKNVYCCSVDTIYKHILLCIQAVNMCDLLKLKFPTSAAEICSVQAGFCNISSNSVITGCVGAIDGLLVVIKCLSMKGASDNNPTSYYSGHYCCHGLNVQAICDSSCCFIFFAVAVAAPGKSSDQAAMEQTSLLTALDCLPLGSYIVGNAAYTLTDQCITPFTGSQRLNPTKDSFNYFLSQVRIQIEMAFG